VQEWFQYKSLYEQQLIDMVLPIGSASLRHGKNHIYYEPGQFLRIPAVPTNWFLFLLEVWEEKEDLRSLIE